MSSPTRPAAPLSPAPRAATTDGPVLTRRASLTAVASWLDYAARIGVGLVVTPIVLAGLGQAMFGVWEVLQRLVAYATLADGRPMEALRLVVARAEAARDTSLQRRAVGMALATWLLFVPFLLVTGAVLVWWAPAITKVEPAMAGEVRAGAALLLVNLLLLTLVSLPEAVLFGTNQGYRRMGLVAAAHVAVGALMVGAVRSGLGLPGLAAAQVVATIGTALLFLRLVRRWVPWFGVARPDRAGLAWFLRLSGWSMAGDAVAKVALASDVVILGLLTSTLVVTSYVLTAYATQAVVGVLSLGLAATVPGLAQVTGTQQQARAVAVRADLLVVAWFSATTVGALVVLWNRSFLDLWVGPGYFAGRVANLLLVLMLVQTVLIRCDASLLNALLRLRTRVQVTAAAALLACVLAAALVPSLGIPGVCLGLLVGRLIQTVAFPVAVNTALGRSGSAGAHAIVRPAAASIVVLAACLALEPRVHPTTWLAWTAGVGASGMLIVPVLAMAGLSMAQRSALWRRAASLGAPVGWSR